MKTNFITLSNIKPKQCAKVLEIREFGALSRRIMDMGITKNVVIEVKKLAPLGDPMELNVRGYSLTLRKSDAEIIVVERLGK